MYRYSAACYNAALLNFGVIRIGTLHDFRRTEHARGIGDPMEGTKHVVHRIEHLHVSSSEDQGLNNNKDYRAIQAFRVAKIEGGAHVTFNNVTMAQKFSAPDAFILCASSSCSRDTLAEFEGAETCIEVTDPSRFLSLLTDSLNAIRPVQFKGIYKVTYQPRQEPWNGVNWGRHPALIKDPDFHRQAELRAIWKPLTSEPISPVILGDYRLGKYCRQVEI